MGGRAYQFRNDGHRRHAASALDRNQNTARCPFQIVLKKYRVQFLVRQIYSYALAKIVKTATLTSRISILVRRWAANCAYPGKNAHQRLQLMAKNPTIIAYSKLLLAQSSH